VTSSLAMFEAAIR